ncbi:hypothetical protein quinque_013952 [Culex quinquefasciatus]
MIFADPYPVPERGTFRLLEISKDSLKQTEQKRAVQEQSHPKYVGQDFCAGAEVGRGEQYGQGLRRNGALHDQRLQAGPGGSCIKELEDLIV